MSYSSAVADLMRQCRETGLEEVPVNILILGRALDAALPGRLEARNGNFYIGSARMIDVSVLYGTIQIPAVSFKQITMVGDISGVVSTDSPPSVFMQNFSAGDISGYIGKGNVEFLSLMSEIWKNRIASTGLQSADSIKAALALLSIGIIVVPDTAERLKVSQPRLPVSFLDVPNVTTERRAAWYTIAERMRKDLSGYYKKQLDVASAAVAAAARDVAFWDGVYTVVLTVRDLPATAAGVVVSAASSVFIRKPIIILASVVAAGAAVWFFWPKLLATFLKRAPRG